MQARYRPEPPFLVAPSYFFVAPRRKPRGPSALTHLGITSRDAVPNEVKGDAVPNEVKDASLPLGRTKTGGSAGQNRGTFLNNPTRGLTKDKKAVFLYKKFTIQEAT